MNPRRYEYSHTWQQAMDLNVEVHELIKKLPGQGAHTLADMLSRFASEVVINIARSEEAFDERGGAKFLPAAQSALIGVEIQLLTCERLGHLDGNDISTALSLCDKIKPELYD